MTRSAHVFETIVSGDLIDYNQHMTEYAYGRVFSDAITAFFDELDIGSGYRARTGCTMYSLETHTVYLREAKLGAVLKVTSSIVGFDGKRLHLLLEMHSDGQLIAAYENLSLHVDQSSGTPRGAAFGEETIQRFAPYGKGDDASTLPVFVGRGLSLTRRR